MVEEKRKLLKKVLNASRKDIVGDGAVDDRMSEKCHQVTII
jgi:hypothetical protein